MTSPKPSSQSQRVSLGMISDGSPAGASGPMRYRFSDDLVTLSDARPVEAEAIRTVRTHIINRHLEGGRRGLAVCAPTSGVGRSFTAVNLAVSLAQVGVATLLIDGNMRAPQVQNFIRPEASSIGLAQCVSSEDLPFNDFVHPDVIPNLSVMFAGGVADNAQELLDSDPFRLLTVQCLRDCEFTIIDTPPANRCADARRIATLVRYALIVAKANVTRSNDVFDLAKNLQEDGAGIVGTVMSEA